MNQKNLTTPHQKSEDSEVVTKKLQQQIDEQTKEIAELKLAAEKREIKSLEEK